MCAKWALSTTIPRRLPKKGFPFALARFGGLLFKIIGLVLVGVAVIGFFIILVRISPTLAESIQHLDQKAGGFTFFISLGYLVVFPIIGLVGVVIGSIGIALSYVGTEASGSKSIGGQRE
jgi:hypothetical protein